MYVEMDSYSSYRNNSISKLDACVLPLKENKKKTNRFIEIPMD